MLCCVGTFYIYVFDTYTLYSICICIYILNCMLPSLAFKNLHYAAHLLQALSELLYRWVIRARHTIWLKTYFFRLAMSKCFITYHWHPWDISQRKRVLNQSQNCLWLNKYILSWSSMYHKYFSYCNHVFTNVLWKITRKDGFVVINMLAYFECPALPTPPPSHNTLHHSGSLGHGLQCESNSSLSQYTLIQYAKHTLCNVFYN